MDSAPHGVHTHAHPARQIGQIRLSDCVTVRAGAGVRTTILCPCMHGQNVVWVWRCRATDRISSFKHWVCLAMRWCNTMRMPCPNTVCRMQWPGCCVHMLCFVSDWQWVSWRQARALSACPCGGLADCVAVWVWPGPASDPSSCFKAWLSPAIPCRNAMTMTRRHTVSCIHCPGLSMKMPCFVSPWVEVSGRQARGQCACPGGRLADSLQVRAAGSRTETKIPTRRAQARARGRARQGHMTRRSGGRRRAPCPASGPSAHKTRQHNMVCVCRGLWQRVRVSVGE